MPAIFLIVVGLLLVSLVHRGAFDLMSTGGGYCRATEEGAAPTKAAVAQQGPVAQQATHGSLEGAKAAAQTEILGAGVDFPTSSMCHPTTRRLVAGRTYRIRLDLSEGPAGEWFDKGRRTDVAGFAADGARHLLASPLKRWWRENWFQPIARIGELGNYEHVLRPNAPLPLLRPTGTCPAADEARRQRWNDDVRSPASPEFKQAQIGCDDRLRLRPSRTLIADITADATGELFLYVNDAVFALPERRNPFYPNNSGTAKVTVSRILATETIAAP